MSVRTMSDTREAIEKYTRLVYGLAIAHTPSRSDADDAFQETFLAYHRCGRRWNCEEHRKAWLIRTAVNMSKRIVFSSWRRRSAPLEDADGQWVEFKYETAEQNEIIGAVKSLPEKYRTAIWLYYFEDMSVKEISSALGISESTVRSQLTRGRNMLRGILGSEVNYL